MSDARAPWVLFVVALVMHAVWAVTYPMPTDMDAQYYLIVAKNLVAGEGAVTRALWNLSILPSELPMSADLHWMPAPSRVLIPGLWLSPSYGGAATNVLLAAAWAPLAWWLARDLGARPGVSALAGVLAGTGGVYVRYLSTTDCYSLYGVLGGLGLVAVAKRGWMLACAVALLAALTRNDGLLLGMCLAVGFRGVPALAVAASGPLGTLCWTWRNHNLAGQDYWRAREISSAATDYLDIFNGTVPPALGVVGRLGALVEASGDLAAYWLTPGLLMLSLPTWWMAWEHRDRGWIRAGALYVVVVPIATVFLAPAVATHGTLYRSGAAMMAGQLALAAIGTDRASDWAHRVRGYPRSFLTMLLCGSFVLITLGMGVQRAKTPVPPSECALVSQLPADAVILTSRPLELELHCQRSGVMVTRTTPPEKVAALVEAYGARYAVVAPDGWLDEGSVAARHIERVLPTWQRRSAQLFEAPASP